MDSLAVFRSSWQQEIAQEKPQPIANTTDDSQAPLGDLCQLRKKSKSVSESETSVPPVSEFESKLPSRASTNSGSFTIGIGTFTITDALSSAKKPSSSTEPPPAKKLRASSPTLLDDLIRDIDESTDVPFFNVSLPREIALHIFENLSIRDLHSCLQVCRAWHSLSCDELLWYNVCKRLHFGQRKKNPDDSWKEHVRETVLSNRQLIQNFKNRRCRTSKLTHRLGIVLTCAQNDQSTIVAGYSAGIIRTWSTKAILDAVDQVEGEGEDAQLDIPDIIYESTDIVGQANPSSVQAVGLLRENIYAMHDYGLLEVWRRGVGDKPHLTQQLISLPIIGVANDEHILCTASRAKFSVWNFQKSQSTPEYQEIKFYTDLNDRIQSFCMSSHHSVPISIVAANKSFWCISLSNVSNRLPFYSTLQSDSSFEVPLDIHNDEPLAIIGVENEIKLFDLQSGRCNIVSTNYQHLPARVRLIRADKCPLHEFVAAFDNSQISIFDRRQKDGAVQHFQNHFGAITTLQMDSWRLASTDRRGFVRLWDRRMQPHSLWHMNPQPHPVAHCSFDSQTLIYALTPTCKQPEMIDYQINPDPLSGHIYVCNFMSNVSTQLDDDLKICTSSYDAPQASNRRIGLHTPYDMIS